MSTEIKAESVNRDSGNRKLAREVLLAGIGAASLLRKNAGNAWTEAAAIAGRMPEATSILIEGIGERSTAMIEEIGSRGSQFRWEFARLARVLKQEASAATSTVVADVEFRLKPLLRKVGDVAVGLGVSKPKAKGKRAVAKKGAAKKAKPVAKRAVRKARKAA